MSRRADPERRAYWQSLLEAQASSGLSVLEFCLQRGVSTASFYNWKRRFSGELSTRAAAAAKGAKANPTSAGFVAIDLPTVAALPPTHYEVLLVDGRRVRVPPDFDRESLIDLFAALGESS